jgi:hypothetical protein
LDCSCEQRKAPARTTKSLVDKPDRTDLSDMMIVILECFVSVSELEKVRFGAYFWISDRRKKVVGEVLVIC